MTQAVFSCEGNCTLPVVDITALRQEDGFHANILFGDPKNALNFFCQLSVYG